MIFLTFSVILKPNISGQLFEKDTIITLVLLPESVKTPLNSGAKILANHTRNYGTESGLLLETSGLSTRILKTYAPEFSLVLDHFPTLIFH